MKEQDKFKHKKQTLEKFKEQLFQSNIIDLLMVQLPWPQCNSIYFIYIYKLRVKIISYKLLIFFWVNIVNYYSFYIMVINFFSDRNDDGKLSGFNETMFYLSISNEGS